MSQRSVGTIAWEACKHEFQWNGSWRDIYVFRTTLDDWRVLCAELKKTYNLEFLVDGEARSFPEMVDEVFVLRNQANVLMRFLAEGIIIACHFFSTEEIEFDIDPREIISQAALDALLNFMGLVGDAVRKKVVLTPENGAELPFIAYEPQTGLFEQVDSVRK